MGKVTRQSSEYTGHVPKTMVLTDLITICRVPSSLIGRFTFQLHFTSNHLPFKVSSEGKALQQKGSCTVKSGREVTTDG